MKIEMGAKATREFVVDEASMRWFQSVSEDKSLIHCDDEFARERGFKGVIAYGGIMLAHLSHILGTKLPGSRGTSTRWTIVYREPLYVDEPARIEFEIVNVSPGTGLVDGKYRILASERTIATGTTQSIVPVEDIEAL